MKILLLLPILVYVLLIMVNLELFMSQQTINLFWASTYELPFFLYNWMFIVIYAILIFFIYDWLNIFLRMKVKRQDREITELKSKLYNWQKDLLKSITKEIIDWNKSLKREVIEWNKVLKREVIEWNKNIKTENKESVKTYVEENNKLLGQYTKENNKVLVQHWKETDKILSKVNLLDKWILNKIKESVSK